MVSTVTSAALLLSIKRGTRDVVELMELFWCVCVWGGNQGAFTPWFPDVRPWHLPRSSWVLRQDRERLNPHPVQIVYVFAAVFLMNRPRCFLFALLWCWLRHQQSLPRLAGRLQLSIIGQISIAPTVFIAHSYLTPYILSCHTKTENEWTFLHNRFVNGSKMSIHFSRSRCQMNRSLSRAKSGHLHLTLAPSICARCVISGTQTVSYLQLQSVSRTGGSELLGHQGAELTHRQLSALGTAGSQIFREKTQQKSSFERVEMCFTRVK